MTERLRSRRRKVAHNFKPPAGAPARMNAKTRGNS